MPRPTKRDAAPTAIVASAARILAGRKKNRPQQGGTSWQTEAWDMLEHVGELEFYREWISNALSRCTLTVVEVLADGSEVEVTDGPAAAALQALFGGDAGQPEMLAAMGGHLAIPGETWLVGLLEPADDPSIDTWRVLSHDEVREQGNRWQIDRGDGVPEVYDADQVYITRIWRPHPRKWVEAHSSVRSALPILREMVGLSQHTAAAIDSRLAGAGILLVPSEITFQSPTTQDDDGTDPDLDPFMAALIEAGTAALADRGDPAALFPILVKASAEHLKEVRHLTLSTPFQAESRELMDDKIKRLAASLDVPAEVLLGMADVNHWTGWLLDENAIKMHVETTLSVATHGLTTRYLWPCLQGEDETLDPALRRYRIKGRTDALRQRPNRTAEAQAAHASLTITNAAWARETGLNKDDLLDASSSEFRIRLLQRLASTSTDPAVIVGALAALGVDVALPALEAPAEPGPAAPADPAGEEPEAIGAGDPLPDTQPGTTPPPEQAAALLAVSEALVDRAVERGWNRAGRRGKVRKPVAGVDLEPALADAWVSVPRAAALVGVDADRLQACLSQYARHLLVTGTSHEPAALVSALRRDVLEVG